MMRYFVSLSKMRPKLKFNEYGLNNHGEFIDYMNPHDNCYWDAIIPGYIDKIEYDKYLTTTGIIGIFLLKTVTIKLQSVSTRLDLT